MLSICMRQQQNQCILSHIRYFMDSNEKVIHVKRQGPHISECKLCITWRDLSHFSLFSQTANSCRDQNWNWRLRVEVTRTSEDPAWQLLAKDAIKIQLPAHQILLNTLQRPLMVSQFQSLPFSLKSRRASHELSNQHPQELMMQTQLHTVP